MNILLLCNYEPYNAAMVSDHINSLYSFSRHNVYVYSHLVNNGGNIDDDLDLDFFDVIIVHYSIYLSVDAYISQKSRYKLKNFTGLKVVFIQDEYRFVNRTIQSLQQIEADILFTCVPEKHIDDVYPTELLPNIKKVQVLTGYVNQDLISYPPKKLHKRKYDISYRGRKYPAWHGRMGREKWIIGEKVEKLARRYNLKTSISSKENSRLYGDKWVELIRNSKAVLGVESGASVFDFTGEISGKVETYASLIRDSDKKYDDIKRRFFQNEEDKYDLSQISPRVLEAISLRTACVLYKGNYSGLLIPWRHYIPLEKDHSNLEEVMAYLKDEEKLAEIISNAYAEVALNPQNSYRYFVEQFDNILEASYKQNKGDKEDSQFNKYLLDNESDYMEVSATIESDRKYYFSKEEFYNKYPFVFIRNPHALTIPKTYRGLKYLWGFMPYRLKVNIKRLKNKLFSH